MLPDWAEMCLWKQTLRSGDLFVDVGANVGLYSVLAAELGAEVIAVEPVDATADQLRANLALNGYSAEVVVAALADRVGTVSIAGPDAARQAIDSKQSGTTVQATTLDSLVGNRHVRGVKIDVEGAERLVLDGAATALSERRIDILQIEWNRLSERCLGETREPIAALLVDAGYELFRPDGSVVAGYGLDAFARPRH